MSFCKAKFKGKCVVCENPISVGEFIVVISKGNCRHKDCSNETIADVKDVSYSAVIEKTKEQMRIRDEQYQEQMLAEGNRLRDLHKNIIVEEVDLSSIPF